MKYTIKLLKDDKTLKDAHWEIVKSIWPEIMLHSPVANKYWARLEEYFPEYQLFLLNVDNQIIGFSNTIPFFWIKTLKELPVTGWDWLMKKGIEDYEKGLKPNILGGLQVGISKEYQGRGYSKIIIKEAISLSKNKGYKKFVIPIRPTWKNKYPLIPMAKYIKWKKADKVFDPWIRTHLNCGAKIVKICGRSMTFRGSIKDWQEWAGTYIPETGEYIVEGALRPVKMNVEKNSGLYYDENIWIYYE